MDIFSSLVHQLYRGCREQPVNTFQDWAFERIKSALPFDSALWLTGALIDGQHAIHTQHLHRQPSAAIKGFEYCKARAAFAEKVISSLGTTINCVTSEYFPPEAAEHYRRHNIEHMLVTTSIDSVTSLHELISVYRASLDQPFSEEERLFQHQLIPHLAETWRINRINKLHQSSRPFCSMNSYFAETNIKGLLHLIEPGFSSLLLDEWPEWRGPRLPGELTTRIESQDKQFVGKTLVVRFFSLNDLFLLNGRKKNLVDMLSQRELEVAKQLAQGASHKEIAHNLAIAPTTARNHVAHVLAKLDIRKGTQVATMLLNEGIR